MSVPKGLNPAPTELQLYLFAAHKAAGTTPGNPRWYCQPNKAAKAPFAWHPGCAPVYPRIESGAEFRLSCDINNDPFTEARRGLGCNRNHDIEVLRQYVAAFDAVMHFKSAYSVTP